MTRLVGVIVGQILKSSVRRLEMADQNKTHGMNHEGLIGSNDERTRRKIVGVHGRRSGTPFVLPFNTISSRTFLGVDISKNSTRFKRHFVFGTNEMIDVVADDGYDEGSMVRMKEERGRAEEREERGRDGGCGGGRQQTVSRGGWDEWRHGISIRMAVNCSASVARLLLYLVMGAWLQ